MRTLRLVFTAAQAGAAGYTPKQVRHRVATRRWITLRRGIYCTRQTWEDAAADEAAQHRLCIAAAMLAIGPTSWAGHSSARRLLGLPRLDRDPVEVQLTTCPDAFVTRSRRHDGINLMPAAVPEHHRTTCHQVPCLTTARTVVDTARTHGLTDGLIAADAALHLRLVEADDLRRVLEDCSGWPGIVEARRVVDHASAKRESPLESRSFAFFIEEGIPLPECQVDIYSEEGILIGRVDFLWRSQRVIGEADGKVKYVENFDDGPRREERLWRERLRHDDLDDAGYGIARWTHADLTRRRRATRERILRSFERAARRFDL